MKYPYLTIDMEKVRTNISSMSRKVKASKLEFRPHFKTHQSHAIGRLFREAGVLGITVSSLKMAQYFALDHWDDITIAFPVNILNHSELNELASRVNLRTLAVDSDTVKQLDSLISQKTGLYIELDPYYNRSGVHIEDFETIGKLRSAIQNSRNCVFQGFYVHAGNTYSCCSAKEIKELVLPIFKQLEKVKKYFSAPICYGDTPSCSVLDNFESIDQVSPGNFVFYDWMQTQIGSCTSNKIAVAMKCPVIAKYPARNHLLVHGGAVHFSKDSIVSGNHNRIFGVVAESLGSEWGNPLTKNVLSSISQEHGIVRCTDEFFEQTKIGDEITVLPIHSCLTADLMGEYRTTEGDFIDHMNLKKYR